MDGMAPQVGGEARLRWPALSGFLSTCCHGDDACSVQQDIDAALAPLPSSERQRLAVEWRDWNAAHPFDDIRFAIEALDDGIVFDRASHARQFMIDLRDRIVGPARREAGAEGQP